ncbi:hypothetical protein ACH4F6_13700 [Streptomyces sp. NPDC017936]|uniref:hypothetical protein n=1 Tax=Streptomyces sp. NPDC017936 TaxID=3365016 RepID=UPI003796328F
MTTTPMTGAEKRLEAGWFQRLAWAVLVWGSLGLLVWVPFLYVAIRRGRSSDWGAFAAFLLYECVTVPWLATDDSPDGDEFMGLAILVTLVTATWMLLGALFDKRILPVSAMAYGAAPTPQGHPYQQRYPYGR